MTKKSRQKFKYLENEKSFQDEMKSSKYFSTVSTNMVTSYFVENLPVAPCETKNTIRSYKDMYMKFALLLGTILV